MFGWHVLWKSDRESNIFAEDVNSKYLVKFYRDHTKTEFYSQQLRNSLNRIRQELKWFVDLSVGIKPNLIIDSSSSVIFKNINSIIPAPQMSIFSDFLCSSMIVKWVSLGFGGHRDLWEVMMAFYVTSWRSIDKMINQENSRQQK